MPPKSLMWWILLAMAVTVAAPSGKIVSRECRWYPAQMSARSAFSSGADLSV
jgi:hypothetical protein